MTKGLEALKDLSKLVFVYGGVEQYKIIEKELYDYEELKENYEYLKDSDEALHFQKDRLDYYKDRCERQDKVLEILRKKNVQIVMLKNSNNAETYNRSLFVMYNKKDIKKMSLIEEEFELLRKELV